MILKKALYCLLGFSALLMARTVSASTYYIDYAGGSDSGVGSKSAPWQHAPGMMGCSANCAAANPQPGDSIILKGGVTWPNAAFPWLWQWSGSSGNNIYIGVDMTWFSGGSWSRPIFNAGGTAITGSGTHNNFFRAFNNAMAYVTIDNLEMTGYFWNTDSGYGEEAYLALGGVVEGSHDITVENCYFHNWRHSATVSGSSADDLFIILGDGNSPWLSGSLIQFNVFDGSDGNSDSGHAIKSFFCNIKNNVIHDIANGILPTLGNGSAEVAYNLVYNIKADFSTEHENALETLGGSGAPSGTYYVHDNVIYNVFGESMFLGNNGETDYVWNNIVYPGANGNPFHLIQNSGQVPVGMFYWNNTIVSGTGSQCFLQAFGGLIPNVTIQNNHCISSSGLNNNISATLLAIDHNSMESPAAASGQGYSPTQTFAYSPTASTDATVGAGTNLSSFCSGTLLAMCSDTTYACTVDNNHQVSCPSRVALARPSGSAAWDAGGYFFGGASSQPSAPSRLSAVVN
jgi:hypothetical protein